MEDRTLARRANSLTHQVFIIGAADTITGVLTAGTVRPEGSMAAGSLTLRGTTDLITHRILTPPVITNSLTMVLDMTMDHLDFHATIKALSTALEALPTRFVPKSWRIRQRI